MNQDQPNRRSFLKATVTGAAGAIAAGPILAPPRVLGANDRIRIGVIGCGGRGTYLTGVLARLGDASNAEIVAACDVWKKPINVLSAKIKEIYGKAPKTCQRYGDILAMKDVDAVIIATPDFAHSRILTEAAWAGKHAFCEKPMANNMADARAAVDAVEANKIICQVGTQRRSDPRFHKAREIVQSGVLGKISEIECCWNRCVPSWLDDPKSYADMREEDVDWDQFLMYLPRRPFDPCRLSCWHLYKDYTIGLVGLLGSHIIDIGTWFMDDPLPLSATGTGATLVWKEKREHDDTVECAYLFEKEFILRYVSRLGNSAGEAETQFRGLKGTFDTATMTATGAGGMKNEAITEPIAVGKIDAPDTDHMRNFLECIRSGKQPNATVRDGFAHSVCSIMAHTAIDQGRRVRYDPESRAIV